MTDAALPNLVPALPEIFMALGAMALLMLGVFRRKGNFQVVSWLAVVLMTVALLIIAVEPQGRHVTFSGMFVTDEFARFMKILVLLGTIATLIMSLPYLRRNELQSFEYPVLILLAALGMCMMISANDLLALYIGLELQSLSLYVLAAFNRDRQRSTEAGLKYFVLGALSSGMLLYGISLLYGYTGGTSFPHLAAAVAGGEPGIGVIVGLAFLVAGLAFKVSAVPFHMWTPDVYEGAPTPVTAFFAAAPKVAAMALFLRAVLGPFPELVDQWRQLIVFLSIASMVLGAFAAIGQTNIKRLMAYSSIGHVGYALIGLAAGTAAGVEGVLIYMAIYLTMTVGTFVCILAMRNKDGMTEDIEDLAGLMKTRPALGLALTIFMFSLAGIPPLAGFFGKLYVFLAAIDAGLYALAVIGVVASVVGAFYYLRIVKIMWFDEPSVEFEPIAYMPSSLVVTVTAVFNSPVFLLLAPLIPFVQGAARSLIA
ncbi:MAG: NADH-quinone oxidoreductase subunit NuoN [Sphingomonadales bacterium]|nr:NADH-quinone oxidoreductase subunit NuoN [Sphingomonadales bacterium]